MHPGLQAENVHMRTVEGGSNVRKEKVKVIMRNVSVEHVASLRGTCKRCGLLNASVLDKYTDAQLAEVYNGIGPDSFPEWVCRIVDLANPHVEPLALIHDVEWSESDGTYLSFTNSNDRFAENGEILADCTFKWYSPRRYSLIMKARAMSVACQVFGWDTWKKYHGRRGSGRASQPCP